MKNKLLFITDAYKDLNINKDTSILMIEEALKLKYSVYKCEINDLYIDKGNKFIICDIFKVRMVQFFLFYLKPFQHQNNLDQ